MRFRTWNVWSMYRSGSLATVARELARYHLDLVGVQEVRWDKWVTVRTGDCVCIYIYIYICVEKETKILLGRFNAKLERGYFQTNN